MMRTVLIVVAGLLPGQSTVLDSDHSLGNAAQSGVMTDNDDRTVLGTGDFAEQLHDFVSVLGIEIGGRLVSQDDFRIVGERPGHSHALFLAAGQLIRSKMQAVL